MVRQLIIFGMIFVLLLLTPIVIATDTQLIITTLANYDMDIYVLKSYMDPSIEGSNLLEQFTENSGNTGRVSVSFSSDESEVTISVIISKNGTKKEINGKTVHKFENKKTDKPINVEIIPGKIISETEPESVEETNLTTNETAEEDATVKNESVNESIEISQPEVQGDQQKITGEVFKDTISKYFSKKTFIIALIIVSVLAISFFSIKKFILTKTPTNFKITKYSELKDKLIKNKASIEEDREIMDVEKKITEVQEEIAQIKNRESKIKEAEKRFREAREELEKLKKG